jgi:hypothetical protein
MSVEKVPSSKLVIGSYIVTLLSYLMIWFSIMILKDVYIFLTTYILIMISYIICGVVVYRDAKKIEELGKSKGVKAFKTMKPITWGFSAFLIPLVMVLIYLYVRKKTINKILSS